MDEANEAKGISRRATWLVFGFFLALGASWATVQPPYGVSDEPAHAIKALATASGQFSGPSVVGPFGYAAQEFEVPSAYSEIWHFVCYNSDVDTTPACAPPFPAGRERMDVPSTAAEYPPLYYALVGWSGWIVPGQSGLFLMRLMTGLIVAALLGWATSLFPAKRIARSIAGLSVAMTPVVLAFTGSVNPFGPEIAASILFWVCCIRLLSTGQQLQHSRSSIGGLYCAALLLGSFRPASFVWIAIIVFVAFLSKLLGRRDFSALFEANSIHVLCSAIAGAVVSLSWYLFAMTGRALGGGAPAGGTMWTNMMTSFGRTTDYLQQAVGFFGWTSFKLPSAIMVLFMVTLVGLASTYRDRSPVSSIGALLIAGFAVIGPAVLEGARAASAGFGFQGRYLLPVICGLPILLAASERARDGGEYRDVILLTAAVGLQIAALLHVGRRFSVGLDGSLFWVFRSEWPGMASEITRVFLIMLTMGIGLILIRFARSAALPMSKR